jgi:hypothetical protein
MSTRRGVHAREFLVREVHAREFLVRDVHVMGGPVREHLATHAPEKVERK